LSPRPDLKSGRWHVWSFLIHSPPIKLRQRKLVVRRCPHGVADVAKNIWSDVPGFALLFDAICRIKSSGEFLTRDAFELRILGVPAALGGLVRRS
jgi:hypothetical protein